MKKGFLGFLIGSFIGSTLAILYAPQSGDETRKFLNNQSMVLKENAQDTLEEAYDALISKLDEAQTQIDIINAKFGEQVTRLQEMSTDLFAQQEEVLLEGADRQKNAGND